MKRRGIILTSLLLSGVLFAACDKGKEVEEEKISGLIGRFNVADSIKTKLTNDEGYASKGEKGAYLYTSDVYPLNTVVEEEIDYATDQRLRLKRDYTYEYSYDIRLRKVTVDGNTELAKLSVSLIGSFTYELRADSVTDYTVVLSDPTSGKKEFYASYIVGENNVYGWTISSTPTFVEEITERTALDRYSLGRTVEVVKAEMNELTDDLFYADFLTDFAQYFSYEASSPETPETPDTPPAPPPDETPTATESAATLPYLTHGGISAGISVGKELKLLVKAPVAAAVDGETLSATNGEYALAIPYAEIEKNYQITAGEESFSFTPAQYLRNFIATLPTSLTGAEGEMDAIANASLAASILQNAGATLSETERNYTFESLNINYYHTDWGKRDNFDISGEVEETAIWGTPTENTLLIGDRGGIALTFSIPKGHYENICAKAVIEGVSLTAKAEKLGEEGENEKWEITLSDISPLDYAKGISVTVYDGENRISETLTYSINRAIAKADLSANAEIAKNAKTHYSLGKGAFWVANGAIAAYVPAVGNGSGRYDLSFGEYSHSYSFTGTAIGSFGSALYIGGQIVSDTVKTVEGENFVAEKSGEQFTITLNGGEIDGIFPAASAAQKVTVIVNADTKLTKILAPMWGIAEGNASLRTDCPLDIRLENGATLTLVGGIICKDLTVQGGQVCVETSLNSTAITCGSLQITDGGLSAIYQNEFTVCSASGLVVTGDIVLHNGNLTAKGYLNGVWLEGDAQSVTTAGNSKLNVEATSGYALIGSAPTQNRELVLNGGECYLEGASGTKYMNITVGNATLVAVANNGYTVEDANGTLVFKTVSGDKDLGKVHLINNTFNEWWDDYYTLNVSALSLNGGSVTVFGMCRGGVIRTQENANVSIANCDLILENGHQMSQAPKAFDFSRGAGATVTVENSAMVIAKGFQAFANAWENSATLINKGLIILDGYQCSLEQWELNAWELKLTVQNDGNIRYTNKVE